MKTTILDFYETEDEFSAAVDAAMESATTEWEIDFTQDIFDRHAAHQQEMYLTERQARALNEIAYGD